MLNKLLYKLQIAENNHRFKSNSYFDALHTSLYEFEGNHLATEKQNGVKAVLKTTHFCQSTCKISQRAYFIFYSIFF